MYYVVKNGPAVHSGLVNHKTETTFQSKGPSINYVSMAEGGRGLPNAHGCSRGGGGCI